MEKSKSQILREKRDTLMQASSMHSSAIADNAKLISAGETAELIAASLAKLKILHRKKEESGFMTKMRNIIPFVKTAEAIEENYEKAAAKGSSVSEVTTNLMEAVSNKRNAVESIVGDLFNLYDNIEETYHNTEALTNDIRESIDNGEFEKAELFNVNTLLAELLEYQTIMRENMQSAKNTIQAAQVSVHQIVALQPKLKAQLDDGLSILVTLNELEELNSTCNDLEELCSIIREDNRESAASAQLAAIERQVKSKEQLLRLENSAKRHEELNLKIINKFKEAEESVGAKVDIMKRIADVPSHNTLENV